LHGLDGGVYVFAGQQQVDVAEGAESRVGIEGAAEGDAF